MRVTSELSWVGWDWGRETVTDVAVSNEAASLHHSGKYSETSS